MPVPARKQPTDLQQASPPRRVFWLVLRKTQGDAQPCALLSFNRQTQMATDDKAGRRLRHDFAPLAKARHNLSGHGEAWTGLSQLPTRDIEAARTVIAAGAHAPARLISLQAVGACLPSAAD